MIKDGPLDRHDVDDQAGHDHRVDRRQRDPAEQGHRRVPESQGRARTCCSAIADGATKNEIVVKPVTIGEENRLLYTRWVKRNADEVDKASGGQLGYVHIPGMNDGAYRTTFEEIMGKYATRKGVVVDTRFNGGGDLVADLAMFLSGKKFFDYTTDTRSNRLRAELPLDEAERRAGERSELQRRPLLRVRVQGSEDRAARLGCRRRARARSPDGNGCRTGFGGACRASASRMR